MNISPINSQFKTNNSPAFNANLWVSKSVKNIVAPNKENFVKAAEQFDTWLQKEQGHISKTLQIRKNSSLSPKVAIKRPESHISYAYPHEETGHSVTNLVTKYEDLEFEMGDKKCGFWFDPASGVQKLVSDFKNMFHHLNKS